MHLFSGVFLFCTVILEIQGEVELNKDRNETVTFVGDQLVIEVDNSLGKAEEDLTLCFGSLPDKSYPPCPLGFARSSGIAVRESEKIRLTVNRQGQVNDGGNIVRTTGDIKFIQDGILNIMVVKMPDAKTIVTLPNAEIYVPEEPQKVEEEAVIVKKDSKAATIGISVGVVVLVLFVLVVVVIVGYCLYRRKKNKKQSIKPPEIVVQVPETPDQTPDTTMNKEKASTPQVMTPTTEPKSPSVEPSTPNPVPASDPKSPATPTPVPSAEQATPPATPSAEPPKPPSKEPVKKAKNAATSKAARSPPTPPFSNQPAAKLAAQNSVFREVADLPYAETANQYHKRVNYKKLGEFARFKLFTENIRFYGLRNGKFNEHDNYVLKLRYEIRPHTVSREERAVLKLTPPEAVECADILVARIEREMIELGFEDNGELDQNDRLWMHLNDESTETSKLYWLLLKTKPRLFKVKYQTIKDDEVQTMPVAMLYAMVLNTELDRTFRENLIHELRRSTVEVIRMVGKDKLRLAAFPLHYLVLLYDKDPEGYVRGNSDVSATSINHR